MGFLQGTEGISVKDKLGPAPGFQHPTIGEQGFLYVETDRITATGPYAPPAPTGHGP